MDAEKDDIRLAGACCLARILYLKIPIPIVAKVIILENRITLCGHK